MTSRYPDLPSRTVRAQAASTCGGNTDLADCHGNKGNNLELRHLRYFAAVAENQSFRLAAERINVTQPAITRQIQDLEQMLGARLFDRTAALASGRVVELPFYA